MTTNWFWSLVTPKCLYLFVDGVPFHLKHYVHGLAGEVDVGSSGIVGNPRLPAKLGAFRIRAWEWSFVPDVDDAVVSGTAMMRATRFPVRHLSTIEWRGHRLEFRIATYAELVRLRPACKHCRPVTAGR